MSKNKNLDELFREKLLNFEQEPPAHLLENILAGVASTRRKRKIIFWRIAGVAAAILLAFVAGWQLNDSRLPLINQNTTVLRQKTDEANVNLNTEKDRVSQIADLTVQGNRNLDAIKTSLADRPTKSENPVKRQNSEKITKTAEPQLLATSRTEATIIKPLKSLWGLLHRDTESGISLQPISSQSVEKSIDQQIMEQNQKLLLVENSNKQKVRWTVGAQVSPAVSVSRSSHSQAYASNMLNSSASNPADLGGGISVEYKKGKRWSLQSGVFYSGMDQTSNNSSYSNSNFYGSADRGSEYLNASVNIVNSKMMMNSTAGVIEFSGIPSQIVIGNSIEEKLLSSAVVVSESKFIQNFEYLEIPLFLRYTVLDSRFDIDLLGGFSSNLLVGNETYMENTTSKSLIGKTKDMETFSYSGTVGFGLKYGLSKRIFLNVEPRVKYYLNSLNSNSAVNYKPYTFGVYTGLSYQF